MEQALNVRTILGIKLKKMREERRLTLSGAGPAHGPLSSYLAEIQAGKKYPKAEKVVALAEALGVSYDELISSKLDQEFGELQGFLSSPGLRDFPFEKFGVPGRDLMKLLSHSPHEVGALLRALSGIARQYNIGVEHFLHAALRSHQELTGNYYEDLEREAEDFSRGLGVRAGARVTAEDLRAWVKVNVAPEIDERTLGQRPALGAFRAVLVPGRRARLLLNPRLSESQKAFVLAREVAYKRLGVEARSFTTPPDREDSFTQVLDDYRASYFAGAVLLPRQAMLADLKGFFRLPTWQAEVLLRLLDEHDVTAETLMYRFSQLVPSQFGLPAHFLRFNDDGSDLRLVKLSLLHHRVQPLRQRPSFQPIRPSPIPSEVNQPISAAGSLATLLSRKILPFPSTTHTLEHSNDTSIPAYTPWSSLLMLGARSILNFVNTIHVRDDRPPSKQAARSDTHSAVASAACLEGRPGPVTPSTSTATN